MNYAPVLIPTLNRFEHLKRCVDSLSRCENAKHTDLFIALDYPSKEEHWEGYNMITEYLESISGFKLVTIIKRDINYGAYKNISDARDYIYKSYDRIILSEDDNEFAPGFLNFVNLGLELYKDNNKVSAICGFSYPISFPLAFQETSYFSPAYSAWGYGTWRDKVLRPDRSIKPIKRFLLNPFNVLKLYYLPYGLYGGLVAGVRQKAVAPDRLVAYSNVRLNRYCLFPTVSLVRNHGFDGSGIHCHVTDYFGNMLLSDKTDFKPEHMVVEYNAIVKKAFKKYYHENYFSRAKPLIAVLKSYVKLILDPLF